MAEADAKDSLWKPLPGTDGTPNESIQDVVVRVRQLMSILETQVSHGQLIYQCVTAVVVPQLRLICIALCLTDRPFPSSYHQFVGEDIVIISPDSYNLSALQAAVLGVDLSQHTTFSMAPGEVSTCFREDCRLQGQTASGG